MKNSNISLLIILLFYFVSAFKQKNNIAEIQNNYTETLAARLTRNISSSVQAEEFRFKEYKIKYVYENDLRFAESKLLDSLLIYGELGPLSNLISKVFIQRQVYNLYESGNTILMDSAIVINGKYEFKLKQEDATEALLVVRYDAAALKKYNLKKPAANNNMFVCSVDNGIIIVKTIDSTFANSHINGSDVNVHYNEFIQAYNKLISEYKSRLSQLKTLKIESQKESIQAKVNIAKSKIFEYALSFLKKHPDSRLYPVIIKYVTSFTKDLEKESLSELFDALSRDAKFSIYGQFLADLLQNYNDIKIGSISVDFSRFDSSGKIIRLSDLRGKYVLLEFWGSWCKPCREGNPHLKEVYKKYHQYGFEILGVAYEGGDEEKSRDRWTDAIRKDGLPWLNVLSHSTFKNEKPVSYLYNITSYPSNLLIDPEGRIIDINLRGQPLDERLKILFIK